jgi:hypothetical protein
MMYKKNLIDEKIDLKIKIMLNRMNKLILIWDYLILLKKSSWIKWIGPKKKITLNILIVVKMKFCCGSLRYCWIDHILYNWTF